jgi:hypothetical protein
LFHLAAATLEFAGAAFGNDYLRAAFAADVNFAELVSHVFERSWHCLLNRTARPSRLRTFYFKHGYDRAPPGLRTLEQRLALFEECAHAFGTVGGGL